MLAGPCPRCTDTRTSGDARRYGQARDQAGALATMAVARCAERRFFSRKSISRTHGASRRHVSSARRCRRLRGGPISGARARPLRVVPSFSAHSRSLQPATCRLGFPWLHERRSPGWRCWSALLLLLFEGHSAELAARSSPMPDRAYCLEPHSRLARRSPTTSASLVCLRGAAPTVLLASALQGWRRRSRTALDARHLRTRR